MGIWEHAREFAGKPVVDWEPGKPIDSPEATIPRLTAPTRRRRRTDPDADASWTDQFAQFLQDPAAAEVTGLVVGQWWLDDPEDGLADMIEALVAARDKLPKLTALFLGDITPDECEISWIVQDDLSPLFGAYPNLEHFRARGGNGLVLGQMRAHALRSLVVEAGALDAGVVRDVLRSELPALEHLELWLGAEERGADTTIEDLAPLFTGALFPTLSYLGLRDSEISDEIAQALAASPLLGRLRVLDLSLGTLGDAGAQALLDAPATAALERLIISHHYCTSAMVERLNGLGIVVEADDPQRNGDDDDEEDYRYVAVSE